MKQKQDLSGRPSQNHEISNHGFHDWVSFEESLMPVVVRILTVEEAAPCAAAPRHAWGMQPRPTN